jgi:hypothetical protein
MMFRPPLVLATTILLLLPSARVSVSGTALPLPSSCRLDEDGPPSYLQLNGGGAASRVMPTPAQKNELFVLNDVWERHLKWSKLSKRMKNQVYFGRVSALVLLISGSIIQTYSHTAAVHQAVFKVLGSAVVYTVPIIRQHFTNSDMIADWTHAKAISERIKGEVYRYQAAVPPYEKKDFEAVKRLVNEVTEIAEDNQTALTLRFARTELTPKEKIPFPDKMDKNRDQYLQNRLDPVIQSYLKDAQRISVKVDYLKKIEGALITASAAIGPLSLVTGIGQTYAMTVKKLSAWPAVVNSCGMAIASHIAACKYEEEAGQWSNAAYKLQNLRLKLPHDAEPNVGGSQETEWRAFVETCEKAILESTVSWTLLKNRPDEGHPKDKL